ncbi:MAG: Rab family GTPase [Candidatus Hodarchaeales archaeon]
MSKYKENLVGRFDIDSDKKFKVVIIGDARAGKTCLLTKYLEDIFLENSRPTAGVNVKSKEEIITISKKSNENAHGRHYSRNFEYWDLGGQRLFEQLRMLYLKGADGIILCFNLNDNRSFVDSTPEDHSVGKFIKESMEVFGKGIKEVPILLVGTQCDLEQKVVNHHINVAVRKLREAGMNILSYDYENNGLAVYTRQHEIAKRMWEAEKWRTGPGWIKTSSKSGEGVLEAFDIIKRALFYISTYQSDEIMQKVSPFDTSNVALPGIRIMTGISAKHDVLRRKGAISARSAADSDKTKFDTEPRRKRNLERAW